jgi:hypothetical protein
MEENLMEKIGYKRCPKWLKVIYRKEVNYICQECRKGENEVGTLEPHRILRGNCGGLYTLVPLNHKDNNVKIVCKSCHKKYHSNEFKRVKSK